MSVSPADFELYSRATGAPYPRTPQERMQMAPEVYNYTRNYAKAERTPGIVSRAAGGLGKAALGALAIGGAVALANAAAREENRTPGVQGDSASEPISEDEILK